MAKIQKVTRKYANVAPNAVKSVSLSLATSEDVREWSHGEVRKPETINYKSFKPEKEGLFDELIFGPTTDYKCAVCGTKYKRTNEGQTCEKTEECKLKQPEILPKSSRRSRMGHIELVSPVLHFWYFKVDHSIISKLLGLREEGKTKLHPRVAIENLIYFKSHIVVESGDIKALPKNAIININDAAILYRDALKEIQAKYSKDSMEFEDIQMAVEELEETASSKMGKDYGIDFYEINSIIEQYSEAKIMTGAKAIEYLLENMDLNEETKIIKAQIDKINGLFKSTGKIPATKIQERNKLYKRLQVVNAFIESGQKPTSMLIKNLPILPADLRPLIQLDGGRHSTTDVNELYRRIIIRNNRLRKWFELEAPILIVQNEMRMLQEAVDALIDNQRRKPAPVPSKDGRPLKSISDALTGKKGRFRQNLLGKRVDYSGRSVIVVGPSLKMHQVGIPRGMAAKLFEPWIVKQLIDAEIASSIKMAKKLIEEQDNVIWPHVEKSIEGKQVLLNRAPTLHRLSVQAFEPVLVRGKAIKLHPLVCGAFNADFDGDQMAVHVPISPAARREAKELMLANKNILGPKDGEPIINPSQDMILGLFYLTQEKAGAKGEGRYFGTFEQMEKAYDLNEISVHARVALPTSAFDKPILLEKEGYIISTVGKFIFNKSFPQDFPFIFDNQSAMVNNADVMNYNAPKGTDFSEFIKGMKINKALGKKDIAKIVRAVFDTYVATITMGDIAEIIQQLNEDNYEDTLGMFSQIKDFRNKELSYKHAVSLAGFVKEGYAKIMRELTLVNEGVTPFFNIDDKVRLLDYVWFNYTNLVADVLDKIKALGFKFSMLSGSSISISDIIKSDVKNEKVKEGEDYVDQLFEMYEDGFITEAERYTLTIGRWAEIKKEVEADLQKKVDEHPENSIFMMMESGARGNIANFVQLAGMRGLMANNSKTFKADAENDVLVKSTIEVPVKSSFLEGLTGFEFFSSTHGARKGLTDTALNTAKSGYLTRRLVDVAQNIVVKEEDCFSDFGFAAKNIIDTKTNTIIVSMEERITGRFINKTVFDKNGEILAQSGELVTAKLAAKIAKAGIEVVEIRSILGCHTRHGVCKKCYGVDLATNRIVNIGEAVGIIAAQSIGEPGTQLTMRTFHTGGVAGVEDITGGFTRLIELIDAYDKPWGRPAVISKTKGEVISIEQVKDAQNETLMQVEAKNTQGEIVKTYKYKFSSDRKIRVKKGQMVMPGQKLVEGPIILKQLLEVADSREVQHYLLKEIQRLYRMQGIAISDKYIEIIIRQMLSKILISDPGDSSFFAGSLVDVYDYQDENTKLLSEGKHPAFGEIIIKGAKQTPLLSSSFLAAASYQETAKVLVHSSISGRRDNLIGLKENIILGHRIPAGTGAAYEEKGKFDIRDPKSYFINK
ncbi:DNA-directed RNA polymerase subunit beta' [Mycoplasma todarodis]|uniref:DNA-directed RNA polymerase subunit beta' n=2 Tax=Mycoplasma todarodis TaxID=1937191 RepID=UPI003B3082AB